MNSTGAAKGLTKRVYLAELQGMEIAKYAVSRAVKDAERKADNLEKLRDEMQGRLENEKQRKGDSWPALSQLQALAMATRFSVNELNRLVVTQDERIWLAEMRPTRCEC